MESFVHILRLRISKDSAILTKDSPGFTDALERWSNIDLKTPIVIVQPTNQRDIATLVKEAHAAKIPFVPASGGHSPWSTIEDGLIIDLSRYKDVAVDPQNHEVTISGGVLMKELQLALAEKQQMTTVANGNTVGAIPYMTGGGISSYTPLIGYACENILSASIVVASGEIIEASENQNHDLLWAIRGAGQFFGIVTKLVVRTYDESLIGPNGVRQIGQVFFPPERAAEVCRALENVVTANDHASSGHFMAMNDPSQGQVLMVAPQYFGTGPELQKTFKPLAEDMNPLSHQHMDSSFDKHSDHLAWMCPKGDFKRFSQTGLTRLNPENFGRLVDLHRELIETLPGTERSVFTIEWHAETPTKGVKEVRQTDTAFGMKDVEIWLNILTWYEDPTLHEKVLEFDRRAQTIMRSEERQDAYIAYTNTSRDDPLEHRYKDPAGLSRLKRLKSKWDPDGCFTKELL